MSIKYLINRNLIFKKWVSNRALLWQIFGPILLMLMFTPQSAEWDRAVTDFFYREGHFQSNSFFDAIYTYGLLPAWILAGGAICLLIGSFTFPLLKKWRSIAIFLLSTLAVGPGILVHAVLKDHWGRPRPRQVLEYGGQQPFRPYYQPNFFKQPEPSKSFPCGHCSMGFYFFALALIGKRYQKKHLYYLGFILAFGLGGLLSFARIAQGGHFLSDTLGTALVVWLTSVGLYFISFKTISL